LINTRTIEAKFTEKYSQKVHTCLKRARLLPFSPYTEPKAFSGTTISTVVFVTKADLPPLHTRGKSHQALDDTPRERLITFQIIAVTYLFPIKFGLKTMP